MFVGISRYNFKKLIQIMMMKCMVYIQIFKCILVYRSLNQYINRLLERNSMSSSEENGKALPQKCLEERQRKEPQPQTTLQNEIDDDAGTNSGKNLEKMMEDMKISDKTQDQVKDEKMNATQKEDNRKSSQTQNQALNQTKYFVDISKTSVTFGKSVLFPGSIQEVDVAISLKDQIFNENNSNPMMLRVIAKCSNSEFDSLDQYVFSVRSNERFQYFEEVRFKIRKKERALVKVAVKIPPVKENYSINGALQIQLQSLQPVTLPISAKCEMPQIQCLKNLYKIDEECSMIKVPAKKNQIRMPPIPFKNLSNLNFTLQIETISNENFSSKPYDIVTQNFVNCQANSQFFVNIQLKENMNYKGVMPVKDTIRKILLLKIRNSSVYFNYPLEVYVFESKTNTGGVS